MRLSNIRMVKPERCWYGGRLSHRNASQEAAVPGYRRPAKQILISLQQPKRDLR
ncbi:hypothetical protein GBAR_LOCUS27925 [Geodia barretti]|uniref:Uncharacterized protein n=1 Tax=Geodia barretti TaxID=519541 RepID=A0AA35TMG0_GEOBA|nr:hypothetical protein GBAR_LOCUS27925 [Geodia barretti]